MRKKEDRTTRRRVIGKTEGRTIDVNQGPPRSYAYYAIDCRTASPPEKRAKK